MSTWHAYASQQSLESGTEVLVTGGHDRVRLQTGDQISIETPDRHRLRAVVIDRNNERLLIAVGEGPLIRLAASPDQPAFGDFKLSDGFASEGWAVR